MIVTFSPTIQQHCLTIPILEDTISESPETFRVSLSSDDPDVSSDVPSSVVTITDEDGVSVGLEMEAYQGSEEDGFTEVCVVVTDGELDREIVVTLATSDGSAEGIVI